MRFLTPFPPPWLDLARDASLGNRSVRDLLAATEAGSADAALDLACVLAMRRPREVRQVLTTLPHGARASTVVRLLEATTEARTGEVAAAGELLREVIHQARIEAHERTLAWALEEGGRAAGILGAKAQSLEWLEEGVAIARRLDIGVLLGLALSSLGMLHGQDSRTEDYARYTEQAREAARAVGDDQTVALAGCNLAGALLSMGQLDASEAAYAEAEGWAEAAGHARIAALVHAGRGGLAFARGDVAAGLEAYARSEQLLTDLGDTFQVTRQRLLTGQALLRLERHREAGEAFERGIAAARRHGLAHLEAAGLGDLAECRLQLGDTEGAHEAFRACIRLQRVDLEAQVRAVKAGAKRAQATLLAMKEAAWDRERRQALEASHRALEEVSRTDALTGLPNRRAFDARVRFVLAQAERYGRPTSLLLLDVDHFKAVNDTHGHDVGDEVLVGLARRVGAAVRATDLFARWGGEEFVVLLPETAADGALAFARTLAEAVRSAPFPTRLGGLAVTVSIGVATLGPDGGDEAMLLRGADEALYRAKGGGRDRAEAWFAG